MKHVESIVQCQYHLGTPTICRKVQLTADAPSKNPREWQSPIWCCRPCRDYLGWHFRYFYQPYWLATDKAKREAEL